MYILIVYHYSQFLILAFNVGCFSYIQLEIFQRQELVNQYKSPPPLVTYDWALKFHISNKSNK